MSIYDIVGREDFKKPAGIFLNNLSMADGGAQKSNWAVQFDLREIMRDLRTQIMRFGLVGITATATHIGTVLLLVERGGREPLTANFIAFALAVLVSFWGHYHWTFKTSTPYRSAFPRFFAIAVLGLGLNQTIMFSAVTILTLDYRLGLTAVIMLVPALSFIANKLWTFQAA